MEPAAFVDRLNGLTGLEITAVAASLRHEVETADGEVSWWRATIAVGADLKRYHRSREAGLVAHRSAAAVQQAAENAGGITKDDVTIVARAASEVARALVVQHHHEVPALVMNVLLAPWRPLVAVPA